MRNPDRTGKTAPVRAINMYAAGIRDRMRRIRREKGWVFLARKMAVFALRHIYARTFLRFRKSCTFIFRGAEYRYYFHPYNFTWDNERAIEIPIVLKTVESFRGLRILEAGNVLSHYVPVTWDVIDKYECAPGVINLDLADFRPGRRYDLIVSISTLEHVGYDDNERDSEKIPTALENLRDNCLKPDGAMLFTMPLGYNPFLDELLFSGRIGFDDVHYFRRVARHEWVEVSRENLGDCSYGTTYIEAGAVAIAEYRCAGRSSG